MEDRELIKKIQMLKSIEPSRQWMDSVDRDLFGPAEPKLGWFVMHWRPALTGLALGLALVGGLLGLIRFGQPTEPTVVQDIPAHSPLAALEDPLTGLKGQIVEFKEQLVKTEPRPDKEKSRSVAEIQQIVLDIRELTASLEEIDRDQVLASLGGHIKEAGEEMKLAFLEKELVELQDQKEQGLLESEKVLELEEIEQLYEEGDSESAFWRLIELLN